MRSATSPTRPRGGWARSSPRRSSGAGRWSPSCMAAGARRRSCAAPASITCNWCDLVIANDLQEIEGGRHTGYFVTPDGKVKESAVGKEAIARALAEYLEEHLDS